MELLLAVISCVGTIFALRGGIIRKTPIIGFDFIGLGLAVASFAAAITFFGFYTGTALVLVIVVHELGHVAAYRVCGHHDARFRLIPSMGGVALCDRAPDTEMENFFITLMGPGICVAPMVLAIALSDWLEPYSDEAASFLWIFASVSGALNFLNLLPLWPLDGGRCWSARIKVFAPNMAKVLGTGMSLSAVAFGHYKESMFIAMLAMIGLPGLPQEVQHGSPMRGMSKWQGVQGLAALLFTAAAHMMGAFQMLIRYL